MYIDLLDNFPNSLTSSVYGTSIDVDNFSLLMVEL